MAGLTCICTKMSFQTKRGILFLSSFLGVFMAVHGTESDIFCLRSIKDSLEDPYNYLSSWNFNNNTEGFIRKFTGVECWHPDENRVLNLKLSNMGLKGQFPRGLRNCSSLTGLDLSMNELAGPIPSDISTLLSFATSIDLSYNKFNGEIPVDFSNCSYLNILRLDNNMLSGQIPKEFRQLPRIQTVSVANNHLSGPVPVFFNFKVNYTNNDGLCGEPLLPCPLNKFHQSFKDGLIVGYVFSVTSVIVVYISYFYCAPSVQLNQGKKNFPNKVKEQGKYLLRSITKTKIPRLAYQMRQSLHLQLVEKESKEISDLLERLTSTLTLEDLQDATDCFTLDNAIGVGIMGIMYRGTLPNGQFLAIKRLSDSQHFERQFLSEIMILSKHRHKNIIPLLGFCIEREEKILVYEYMSNGRLSKWLHPLESEVVRLKWPQRVNIALGIAKGLGWLHHGCDLPIVHLNMCSECILLDVNFEPKISNFGHAKFMNPNTEDDQGVTFKENDREKDVYDFGSVLFELITGKSYTELSPWYNIANFAKPSHFYKAIDESLIREGFENEVYALFKVACDCVQPLGNERPTMLEVYNNVSNIMKGRHGSGDDHNCAINIDEIVEL